MQDHDLEPTPIDLRIQAAADEGCEASRQFLNRRTFMGVSASLSAWAFLPRRSSAAGNNNSEKRLLVVLLQGGMDGLHVAPPLGDPAYGRQRRSLAQNASTQRSLDGFFYFNQSMPHFYNAYLQGQAAIVHAIAPPLRVRSHFECMYNLESGFPGQLVRSAKSGWMNRLLEYIPAGEAVASQGLSKGLQMGSAPLILSGPNQVLSWTPDRWARSTANSQAMYAAAGDAELADLLSRGKAIRDLALSSADGRAVINQAFHGAGNLMAAPNGPRIAAMQIVGFDTHVSEVAGLNSQLSSLDNSIQEFREALGEAAWANTVVVCVSEFGRTVWDNGRNGTDHGTGTAALLVGGAVAGGRVIADWPGLATLQDGRDLMATVCTRKLFKGILQDHLGISRTALDTVIFPDSAQIRPMEGLIRGTIRRRTVSSAPVSVSSRQVVTTPQDVSMLAE